MTAKLIELEEYRKNPNFVYTVNGNQIMEEIRLAEQRLIDKQRDPED